MMKNDMKEEKKSLFGNHGWRHTIKLNCDIGSFGLKESYVVGSRPISCTMYMKGEG